MEAKEERDCIKTDLHILHTQPLEAFSSAHAEHRKVLDAARDRSTAACRLEDETRLAVRNALAAYAEAYFASLGKV